MASQELPSDMIFEILSRTTLQTLDRSKCVCKDWKHQIDDDPNFLPIYYQRTNNISGFFIQDVKPDGHISTFASVHQPAGTSSSSIGCLPHGTRILASSDQGIMCCVRSHKNRNDRYYAHKPSTRQWQALPNPKLRYWTVAVGMVVSSSNPLRFKIVRLSRKGFTKSLEYYQYRCEIFDSMTWKWKETQMQTLELPCSEHIDSPTLSMPGKGTFHWLTTRNNVVTFREATESFHTLSLPEAMLDDHNVYQHKNLVEYEGKLGLSCATEEGKVELWTMEGDRIEGNRVEWRKHKSVDIGRLEERFTYPYPVGFYKGGILLLKAFTELVFYRVEDGNFSVVKLGFKFGSALEIFQFRSDLDQVCFRPVSK